MKTLFIASGPIAWASARMRCYWPAAYMDADVVELDNAASVRLFEYDAVVFQKTFNMEAARDLQKKGKLVYLDACDPLWWFNPQEIRAALPLINGVVCSNEPLRVDFAEWCDNKVPSYTIPDRLELSAFPVRREQADVSPVRFIWFGMSGNRVGLASAFANLERLAANGYPIELTVFDDHPEQPISDEYFTVYHTRWSLDAENEVISSHDLALLPPYPGAWGRVKSNNRVLTAWASGLAVTDGLRYPELVQLVEDYTARRIDAAYGLQTVREDYRVEQSARDWEAILCA